MEIIWTNLAKLTYFEITENINDYWNREQSKKFIHLVNKQLHNIKTRTINHKLIYKNVRKCIIHKNVSLYYMEYTKNKTIILITFYSNRVNPSTLYNIIK